MCVKTSSKLLSIFSLPILIKRVYAKKRKCLWLPWSCLFNKITIWWIANEKLWQNAVLNKFFLGEEKFLWLIKKNVDGLQARRGDFFLRAARSWLYQNRKGRRQTWAGSLVYFLTSPYYSAELPVKSDFVKLYLGNDEYVGIAKRKNL